MAEYEGHRIRWDFGTGFNQSHVYVPVRESDMIFSVIGENFGFIGSCILILLYFC